MKNSRSYITIIALMLSILSGAAQEMRDGSYRFIGTAKDIPPRRAAIFYFFNLFQ